MNIDVYLDKKRKIIDKALLRYLPAEKGLSSELIDAMRYSVMAGGKRIRPIIMMAIADMLNKTHAKVLPVACAVEYMHTSTLILDDLPCMDDSDLRRGRASLHKKYGQSTAVLAAFSLMALAFDLLLEDTRIIKSISKAIGFSGVCAGQFVDLKSGSKKINPLTLAYIHEHKTADLFVASCGISAISLDATDAHIKALEGYGKYIGLAFQIYDDMLSIDRTDSQLGKQTKKDKNSPNVVNLLGAEKARMYLKEYSEKAEKELYAFGKRAHILKEFIKFVSERDK